MDPDALKLAKEIEASRQEIEKLQERVRQLVARRGKRAELVKSAQTISSPEIPAPASVGPAARSAADDDGEKELTIEEGLIALRSTPMSDIRLIAFKHGAVIFLFANERTMTVRMDERGPKPLLDLLTANEARASKPAAPPPADKRSRA